MPIVKTFQKISRKEFYAYILCVLFYFENNESLPLNYTFENPLPSFLCEKRE